jgi:hypothetical protein
LNCLAHLLLHELLHGADMALEQIAVAADIIKCGSHPFKLDL